MSVLDNNFDKMNWSNQIKLAIEKDFTGSDLFLACKGGEGSRYGIDAFKK